MSGLSRIFRVHRRRLLIPAAAGPPRSESQWTNSRHMNAEGSGTQSSKKRLRTEERSDSARRVTQCVSAQESTMPTTTAAVLLAGHERAVMPRQPRGRRNACWVSPVVALARFYGVETVAGHGGTQQQQPVVTVESVLALRGDDAEEVVEVFEQVAGVVLAAPRVWSDDAAFFENSSEPCGNAASGASAAEKYGGTCRWMGPTSENDFGTRKVAVAWFADVRRTIAGGDPVLLLVERLDGGKKDRGNTHYLLCLGCEEEAGRKRRGRRTTFTLRVKDPMEGDTLLAAPLWNEPHVELMTRQATGRPLDRYGILESTHLCGLGALIHSEVK